MTTAPALAIALTLAAPLSLAPLSLPLASGPAQDAQPDRADLRRVAPGYEDFSPVALSRRLEPVDIRATLFAEDVYEGERTDRFGSSERIYMRMYGGIVAVFPRSSYTRTSQGVEADIPPGTVFHLGTPAEAIGAERVQPRRATLRPGQVDLRHDLSAAGDRVALSVSGATGRTPPRETAKWLEGAAGEAPGADQGLEAGEPLSIFNSERYRQQRMASLLAEAARAQRHAGRVAGSPGT